MILSEAELEYACALLKVLKPLTINQGITIIAFVLRTMSNVAQGDLDETLETRMRKFLAEAQPGLWQLH